MNWTDEDEDIAEANASRKGGTRMTHRDPWTEARQKLSDDPGNLYTKSLRTVREPWTGATQTWVIETWKAHNGFHVSLQVITAQGEASRFMLSPPITHILFSQPKRLTKKSRSEAGKKGAATARAGGIVPFETKGARANRYAQEAQGGD